MYLRRIGGSTLIYHQFTGLGTCLPVDRVHRICRDIFTYAGKRERIRKKRPSALELAQCNRCQHLNKISLGEFRQYHKFRIVLEISVITRCEEKI